MFPGLAVVPRRYCNARAFNVVRVDYAYSASDNIEGPDTISPASEHVVRFTWEAGLLKITAEGRRRIALALRYT